MNGQLTNFRTNPTAISKSNANHDNEHHDKYNLFETYSNITVIVIIDGRALIFLSNYQSLQTPSISPR